MGMVLGAGGAVCLGTALASAIFNVSDPQQFASRVGFMLVCAGLGVSLLLAGVALMGRSRLREVGTWLDRDPGIPLWMDSLTESRGTRASSRGSSAGRRRAGDDELVAAHEGGSRNGHAVLSPRDW